MNAQRSEHYSPRRGLLYAVGGTFLLATNFCTAKYAMGGFDSAEGFDPGTFALVWTSAAAFYSLVICLATGRTRELAVPRRAAWAPALLGVCTGAGMLLAWAALDRLDPPLAAFIARFTTVMTVILGVVLLRERLRGMEVVAMAVMVTGGLISTVGRWEIVGLGVALMFLTCAATALQNLVAKVCVRTIHPSSLVFLRLAIGAAVIAVWVLGRGAANFQVPARYWIVALLGAFLGPCLAHHFTFRAYHCWDLSRVSIVRTAEPLFVLSLALLVSGRLPAGRELLGGGIILVGAFLLAWIHFGIRRGLRKPVPHDAEGEAAKAARTEE
ncbi:MAG: DMT family transporter [Candidatus Brocadiia bacterium]|jgi:drug/metabolite transporter (DMT)-like permease|nr:DMT family transporter [Candidatus Brocadiia bacterium]